MPNVLLLDKIKDVLYPRGCVCYLCSHESVTDSFGLCGECRRQIVAFSGMCSFEHIDGFSASFLYAGAIADAVKRYKFNYERYYADFFAQFIDIPESWRIDIVVPVPLHKKRLRERGFNQSELLASRVCARFGLKLNKTVLRRVKNTPHQSQLDSTERVSNMRGAFEASRNLNGKSVLIIDDVCTTGSTLEECALALKLGGASHVYALTVAASSRHSSDT